ncbi:MAG: transposase, partial [Dehalococcoidia bacterium]|nr:transposase [Dehalococcoidia bacterium]
MFVTAVTSGRWPFFADPRLATTVRDVFLSTAQDLGVTLHAWVIMPDHVHLLLNPGQHDLSRIMRLLKGRSARAVNKLRRTRG